MLDDYFSLEIDKDGNLHTIPQLLEGYIPFFGGLPIFLLRLATEVNWDEEEACFQNLAEELSMVRILNIGYVGERSSVHVLSLSIPLTLMNFCLLLSFMFISFMRCLRT